MLQANFRMEQRQQQRQQQQLLEQGAAAAEVAGWRGSRPRRILPRHVLSAAPN